MPLRDDWASAAEVISQIGQSISPLSYHAEIVLVDDGSKLNCQHSAFSPVLGAVRAIRVLRLRRNLGHQRAIAIGLAHIEKNIRCDAVLVMDADGEDTPQGVLQLLDAYSTSGGINAIFAERSRRTESLTFRFSYWLYKMVHRALTGVAVRVGNFSILPSQHLSALSVMPELWNHYAAAVFRSKLPFTSIPIPRGQRISGTSHMNFVALVAHGLGAMAVFGDIVGVRILIASLAGSFLAFVGIVVVLTIRLLTDRAIPGWATYASGTLAVLIIQCITIATSFTFFMLANRTNLGFVAVRDYALFVAEETIY